MLHFSGVVVVMGKYLISVAYICLIPLYVGFKYEFQAFDSIRI